MSEMCPTFLVSNDTITEVAYTEWEEITPGEWGCLGNSSERIPITSDADRVVFELPIGCFEVRVNLEPGTVSFGQSPTKGRGMTVAACTQRAHFTNEIKQTTEMVSSQDI